MREHKCRTIANRRSERQFHHRDPENQQQENARPAQFVQIGNNRIMGIDFEYLCPAIGAEADQMIERGSVEPSVNIARPDIEPARQ